MLGLAKRKWLDLVSSISGKKRGPERVKYHHARPQLLSLEDRTLPAVSVLRSFAGLAFPDSNGYVPPDTSVAAGPSHIVEVVNSAIGIYSKANGTRLSLQSLDAFFGVSNQGLFDPVVAYDDIARRFIVIALAQDDTNQTSDLYLAVSNSSNPTAGFSEMHQIDIEQLSSSNQQLWGDYPKLGYNRQSVVVTLNMYGYGGGSFDHVQVRAFDKSTLLDANPSTMTDYVSNRNNDFTMAAAVMHNAPAGAPMWFVQTRANNTIRVTRMTNILSNNPTYTDTDIAVSAFGQPPNAAQPGGVITTNDNRMMNAEWRGNRLVAAHTIGLAGRANARWYEFNTAGAAPTLTQQGTINRGAGIHTYFPSIAIAPNGSLGMTFMQSAANQFISMFVTARANSDPAGTMQPPRLARAGQRTYSDFSGSPYRAGDYSGISVDPVNGTFWAANEYATNAASDNWGTWIANFTITGGPGPGPGPGPRPIPGRFIINRNDNNESSASAANLGTVRVGSQGIAGLAITRTPLGLPDYDWYRFVGQKNGKLTIRQTVTRGQPLQVSLFVRQGNMLVRVAAKVVRPGSTGILSANIRAGANYFLEVKGINLAPGILSMGGYNLGFTLA